MGTLHYNIVILRCGNVAGMSFSQRWKITFLQDVQRCIYVVCLLGDPSILLSQINHLLDIFKTSCVLVGQVWANGLIVGLTQSSGATTCGLICSRYITTHSPVVTDVFGSGRNVGALRPARRVGFRCQSPGLADDISRCTYYFCNDYSS